MLCMALAWFMQFFQNLIQSLQCLKSIIPSPACDDDNNNNNHQILKFGANKINITHSSILVEGGQFLLFEMSDFLYYWIQHLDYFYRVDTFQFKNLSYKYTITDIMKITGVIRLPMQCTRHNTIFLLIPGYLSPDLPGHDPNRK